MLGFLAGKDRPLEESPVPVTAPGDSEEKSVEGILWEKALDLARQQGRGEDDNYVTTIFLRMLQRVTSNG